MSYWSSDVCSSDLVIQFHVPIVVPRQRADAVSGLQTHARERTRELSAAPGEVRVGVAVEAAFHRGGYDFGVTVISSEESRVGTGWFSECRSRWSTKH